MYFLTLLAAVFNEGTLPGGAGENDPVPHNLEQYTTPVGYGIFAFIVLVTLLFLTTRFKVDR